MLDYPLSIPTWGDGEAQAVRRVLDSGRVTMGPEVATFERRFAEFVGADNAVMVNSGSSANLLAVAAMCYAQEHPLCPGDEVIVPAVGWSTSYAPLAQYGARLIFVDIDPATLNVSPSALMRAVRPKTRGILAINMLGNPNEFRVLLEIAEANGLFILEDNCESLGAEYLGKQAGTFGTLGTYSFYFSHHMSTGEGGMVVTDDKELCQILLALRAHGWTRDLTNPNLLSATICEDPFYETFRFVLPGYNVRPLEFCGAVGLTQLERFPKMLARRRENARCFAELFGADDRFMIQEEVGQSSWFAFALTVERDAGIRAGLVQFLATQGVECRPIGTGNFLRSEMLRRVDHEVIGSLEASERIHMSGFFFGNHPVDLTCKLEQCYDLVDRHVS